MISLALAVSSFVLGAVTAARGRWLVASVLLCTSAFLFFGLGVMCGAGPLSSCAVLQ